MSEKMDDTKYDVYYKSRKTGRTYESLGQLKTDEAKWDADHKAEVEKLNARKADAAKVEEARKEYEKVCADVEKIVSEQKSRQRQAYYQYHEKLNEFVDKYGSYHYSLTGDDLDTRLSHFWDDLFNF